MKQHSNKDVKRTTSDELSSTDTANKLESANNKDIDKTTSNIPEPHEPVEDKSGNIITGNSPNINILQPYEMTQVKTRKIFLEIQCLNLL